MPQKLFVITLNYNGKNDTLNCLKSLTKSKLTKNISLHIIVVDNASHDDSISTIKKQFPQVIIHSSPINTGFAQGNNLGINLAREQNADFIVLLNNDTQVAPDALQELVKATQRHAQGGIFSPKIYFAPGREFHKQRYKKSEIGKVIWSAGGKIDWQNMFGVNIGMDEVDGKQFSQEKPVDSASGCCLLLTKEAISKLKGFDQRYYMYYEDVDLCLRAQKTGLEIWYIPQAKIWHVSAGSTSVGSPSHDYFIARNRMLAGLQYAPLRTKLALIKESLRLLLTGRPWQKTGIWDFYIRKFGRGSWSDQPEK